MNATSLIGNCQIGDGTLLDESAIIGYPSKAAQLSERTLKNSAGAIIGANCIIRSNSVIYENTILGDNVQTANNVIIREDVTIGDGCCIGSRSVITKDLPPYTICVGQPCKPVKNRYNKEIIDFLLNLQWWDWDKEKIKINKKFFMTNLNTIKNVNELEKIIC